MGTAIVVIILVAVVTLIIWRMVKDRKAGKSSCGCGCASCPMAGQCHSKNKKGFDITIRKKRPSHTMAMAFFYLCYNSGIQEFI